MKKKDEKSDETLIRTGLIGYPVKHSKSPLIHAYWREKHEKHGMYEAISVHPNDLEKSIEFLIDKGYAGFNVTVPHKTKVLQYCDKVDAISKVIDAANTITIRDGKLSATNTDAYGFIQSLRENAPEEFDITKGKAVVLGAGGAANAILYALLHEDVPAITITNRTREKAEKLQEQNVHVVTITDWDNRHDILEDANIIINTTSLGMDGFDPLDLDLSKAPEDALVCDIVYAPLMTDLLTQAQERGMPILTGIGMLLHQARPGFKMWYGVLPEVDEKLERIVLK